MPAGPRPEGACDAPLPTRRQKFRRSADRSTCRAGRSGRGSSADLPVGGHRRCNRRLCRGKCATRSSCCAKPRRRLPASWCSPAQAGRPSPAIRCWISPPRRPRRLRTASARCACRRPRITIIGTWYSVAESQIGHLCGAAVPRAPRRDGHRCGPRVVARRASESALGNRGIARLRIVALSQACCAQHATARPEA